jgi:hypothetical protein
MASGAGGVGARDCRERDPARSPLYPRQAMPKGGQLWLTKTDEEPISFPTGASVLSFSVVYARIYSTDLNGLFCNMFRPGHRRLW